MHYMKFQINNLTTLFYNRYNYIEGIHFGYAHGITAIIKVLSLVKHENFKKKNCK